MAYPTTELICVFSNLLNPAYLVEHLSLCLSGSFSNCNFNMIMSFRIKLSGCVRENQFAGCLERDNFCCFE